MSGYIFALVFGVLTAFVMFSLLRSRTLREKYASTWMVVAVAVVVLAAFPGILEWSSDLLGVRTPANLLFFVGALALLIISVQYSVELSRLEARTRTLAEEVAILRAELDAVRSAVERRAPEPDDADG